MSISVIKAYKLKVTSILLFLFFATIFTFSNPFFIQAATVSVTGKAKILNTNNSYLDFTNYNSNVTISDSTGNFSGYAFLEDMGWVAFGTTDNSLGPVNVNLTSGVVSGKAKTLNTSAYLNFTDYSSNVTINIATGVFSGYVFSEDTGWIDFSDTGVSASSALDSTAPLSFDLDSPGGDVYINEERPVFRWKATTDAVSELSKYQFEVNNGDSGDFTLDDIPTSRTTDYETSKYIARYHGFSDDDDSNDYISIQTKSTSDWGSDDNDGKLKEGKRTWAVKAVDAVSNERTESRTLFVDRTGPNIEATQVNSTPFSDNLTTADKKPTIYGKITDSLTGDKTDNNVASGPKEVEIKFEKRNYLGVYSLHTLTTINISEAYWSSTGEKITDNSKNTSNKYSSFSYTPTTDLPFGTYKITLTGKDSVGNSTSTSSITLNIKTFVKESKISEDPEEKEEDIEEITKEKEAVVLEESEEPSKIAENFGTFISKIVDLWWKTVDIGKFMIATKNDKAVIIATGGEASSKIFSGIKTLTSRFTDVWQTNQESTDQPPSEKTQALITRLKVATSSFIAIVFDKEPTRIFDVQVEKITPTDTIIVWHTNHYATSKVNYGFSTQYGKEVYSNERVKEHRMVLENLEPENLYYFEVMSQSKNYVYDAYHTFETPKKDEKVKGITDKKVFVTITVDKGSWVLVRDAPSLNGEILSKVTAGQSFPLSEEKNGWIKIKLDNQEGWVFGELVKIGEGTE